MRSEPGERRMNPLSPVSFFSHTQCGKIASAKLNLSFQSIRPKGAYCIEFSPPNYDSKSLTNLLNSSFMNESILMCFDSLKYFSTACLLLK